MHNSIKERLRFVYGDTTAEAVFPAVEQLLDKWKRKQIKPKAWVDEKDVLLITYGDSICKPGEQPLRTLNNFLNANARSLLSSVHILPMYPYTSDDGFSVVDFYEINPDLGSWDDIESLSENYNLMFDAVINHISVSSQWFQKFLECDPKYKDYFVVGDMNADYSSVTRPRALPLLTPFETKEGKKHVWTTFSADQVDLNFKNPDVLLDILDVLCFYASKGAKYIRLDAVGFMWKELGTTCMHLPQTHELIKIIRDVLDIVATGTIIITETNVPHRDNVSYFGNGHDEAHMVYQFTLPPLVLHTFHNKDAQKLLKWMDSLGHQTPSENTTYFNFLSSHDGIGMRPVEGILTEDEKHKIQDKVLEHSGKINYRFTETGEKISYEMNINYCDALTALHETDDVRAARSIAAHSILLSVIGMPAIYVHTLFGSRNWYEGVAESGINRRINREKLLFDAVTDELNDSLHLRRKIFSGLSELMTARKNIPAFHPNAEQHVVYTDTRLVTFIRYNKEKNSKVWVVVNISDEIVEAKLEAAGTDVLTGDKINGFVTAAPYQTMWIIQDGETV